MIELNGVTYKLADWYIEQNSDILGKNFEVKKETAKAYLLTYESDIGPEEKWIPKSSLEELDKVE